MAYLFLRSTQVLQSAGGWSVADWRTVWDAVPEGFAQDCREWTEVGPLMLHCLALEKKKNPQNS